jgi:hypothetical protein
MVEALLLLIVAIILSKNRQEILQILLNRNPRVVDGNYHFFCYFLIQESNSVSCLLQLF